MLYNPLDSVLGTVSKVRLLRVLIPLERRVSGREAARLAGVSRIAQRSLDELADLGILSREQTTGQYLYGFSHEHLLAPSLIALFEAERDHTRGVFARLNEILETAGAQAESAVIFGSAVRGEARAGSDLDMLVVATDAPAKELIYDALVGASSELETAFGLRLSPVVVVVDQVRRQRAEGDAFISEVLRESRRICGRPLEEVLSG